MLKTTIYKITADNEDDQKIVKMEGDAKNELLVIVKGSDLTEESRKTLSQMLNAIKYNFEDSCMINLDDNQSISINGWIKKYNIKKVLCFGIAPKIIGLQIAASAYRMIEMEELRLIFSHSITDLNADKQKKIKLWNVIQNI